MSAGLDRAGAPLFRREVLDSRRDLWLGEAQLVHPIPVKIAAAVCVALAIATSAFVTFGTYTRRVHAEGVLAPDAGLITVASPIAGRIRDAAAGEGERVAKGQLLYTIDVDAVSASGPTQQRVIAELAAQRASVERQRRTRVALAAMEKTALREQLDNTIEQDRGLKSQIALQQKLTQAVKAHADQLQIALANGVVRAADVQNQNYIYIQASSQLAQFQQTALQLDGRIADLTAQLAQFDDRLAREIAEMDRAIAQIRQQIAESEARQAIEVRAPAPGVLTSIRVHAGQQVAAGAPMLTVLPGAGHLQANLYVDSSAIGLLADGQSVMLRYAAFPFQRFGAYHGEVAEVTRAPIDGGDPQVSAVKATADGSGLYRIIVRPDQDHVVASGVAQRLDAGMRVEADIALEKRPLYRWLLDPVSRLQASGDLVLRGGLN